MSTTSVVENSTTSLPLGAVAGYGQTTAESVEEDGGNEVIDEPNSRQVTPTKVYPSGTTSTLASQSTSSLGGSRPVPTNRQNDFEKLFGKQLSPPKGEDTPDFYTVCQTQSADLQASVLLHGRLYLTRYHLCFRSNICGYVTEKIHDLRDVVSVERSTTAKWIQNAISLTLDTDSDEKVVGYGSMGDREAMYEGVMELWKLRAPDRYTTFMDSREAESEGEADLAEDADIVGDKPSYAKSKRNRSATTATQSDTARNIEIERRHRAATATGDLGHNADGVPKTAHESIAEETTEGATDAQTTECSGQHYDELALDTTLPVKMEQLYKLMYHTPEFGRDWLENKQKLTDVEVGDWEDKGGAKERSLTYVMHMNNYIGPKKSDCIGSERIEIEDPSKAYEIVSETQTPDVPSGKSFKIHTRTCLTHADVKGAPATRMYCTTQCDWSASSMLKSTITPAVIKGQKEYHQKWLSALKEWIDAHPADFESGTTETSSSPAASPAAKAKAGSKPAMNPVETQVAHPTPEKPQVASDNREAQTTTMADQIVNMIDNQILLTMMVVCAMSLALNIYLLSR